MAWEATAREAADRTTNMTPQRRAVAGDKGEASMAKKVVGQLKLQVPAGQANPSPPDRPGAGSARHQHHGVLQGVQRQDAGDGAGRPDADRDHLLRGQVVHLRDQDVAGVVLPEEGGRAEAGGQAQPSAEQPKPGREPVGTVTVAQVREIAEAKMKDLNANDVEAAMQIIVGSARSMGIEVKG